MFGAHSRKTPTPRTTHTGKLKAAAVQALEVGGGLDEMGEWNSGTSGTVQQWNSGTPRNGREHGRGSSIGGSAEGVGAPPSFWWREPVKLLG